jgi:hypothetical protein
MERQTAQTVMAVGALVMVYGLFAMFRTSSTGIVGETTALWATVSIIATIVAATGFATFQIVAAIERKKP